MVLDLTAVLDDPQRTIAVLQAELFGLTVDVYRPGSLGGVVLDLTLHPLPEFAAAGYRRERARISVRRDGKLFAFPLGLSRRWKHRELSPLGGDFGWLGAELCLWYPADPRPLRWDWPDGFEQYVTRVHRHLFFEEYWRRTGHWPVEDAPHGDSADGAHPVLSRQMRKAISAWAS